MTVRVPKAIDRDIREVASALETDISNVVNGLIREGLPVLLTRARDQIQGLNAAREALQQATLELSRDSLRQAVQGLNAAREALRNTESVPMSLVWELVVESLACGSFAEQARHLNRSVTGASLPPGVSADSVMLTGTSLLFMLWQRCSPGERGEDLAETLARVEANFRGTNMGLSHEKQADSA